MLGCNTVDFCEALQLVLKSFIYADDLQRFPEQRIKRRGNKNKTGIFSLGQALDIVR